MSIVPNNNNLMYPKGSEWRKWDLHIHSPSSILNNQYPKLADGSLDWESFVQKLETLDLAVVGITDYFTIEGYKKVLEFKEQGRLDNIHTILPNIEFRLKSVISSKKDGECPRRLNFHVIFSDEVSVQDIEEHFLHDIEFYYEGNPQDRDDVRKLKLSNIEELGNKLISQHDSFQDGRSSLEIGATMAVVDHEDITKILSGDSRFRGKYIIVFPEELFCLIDWNGQDHHIRKGVLQKSDMVFSSNPKTREWCLGNEPYKEGQEHFVSEFKTLKPCIHGCDAHRLEDVGRPCASRGQQGHVCDDDSSVCELRHCWVKADPTFEGLKQLLYEPSERVIVQVSDPTPIKSNYTIDGLNISGTVVNDELAIRKTELKLNSALVAVAGGKGSGKTALVDLMANCYMDRRNTEDRNSFVRRIADQAPDIETEICFSGDTIFSKKLADGEFFEDSDITYIAQGELEEYVGEESDFDTYVKNLVFENPQIKDSVRSFEFVGLTEKVSQLDSEISAANSVIESIEKETAPEKKKSVTLKNKKLGAELRDVGKQIKGLEKGQSEDKIALVREKQQSLSNLKSRKDFLIKLRDLLQNTINLIEEGFGGFNNNIAAINKLLEKLGETERFSPLSYEQQDVLATKLEEVKAAILVVVQEIDSSQKHIQSHEKGVQDHARLLDRQQAIKGDIEAVKLQATEIENKNKHLDEVLAKRKVLFREILETILSQKAKYEEIITTFAENKAQVLSDLDFGVQVKFDSGRFLSAGEDVLDNRKVTVAVAQGVSVFSELLLCYESVTEGDEGGIDKVVSETERLSNELKSKLKSSTAITVGDFYAFLYGNYMSVTPIVRYKKTSLSKLSLGQKATVLIKIYLAQGDKPIIIDSHDDHLDNEFIMGELVSAIREAKRYRQIILVSNNGNVVINSDAEQVVLANIDNGEISYISGSIEEPSVRDRALEVLEGGAEAFKKRQQKYRMGA